MNDETSTDDPALIFKLQRPITAHGQQTTELRFREPTGGDFIRHGNPVRFVPGQDITEATFDEVKLAAQIAALAAINRGAVEQMHPQDIVECGWLIAPFFIPGLSTKRSAQP